MPCRELNLNTAPLFWITWPEGPNHETQLFRFRSQARNGRYWVLGTNRTPGLSEPRTP